MSLMSTDDNKIAQQRRHRGFWAKLKNPKTLKWVFRIVGFGWKVWRLLGGDFSAFFDK